MNHEGDDGCVLDILIPLHRESAPADLSCPLAPLRPSLHIHTIQRQGWGSPQPLHPLRQALGLGEPTIIHNV